ncbi:hypothetical protein FC26_GL000856 [Paucilactobacillus vaccinostercus DSM 20634]|uniref:Uncharacterized protein n=2 Tax=Paucilactobacillus vaccinostercus TaxID=176291 RepID=A0A0R2AD03_9LACO|nr:hypothetical protein FC26_GL000856 [Paucilactobacillus vaccinostercus DSM 20634]
MTMTNNYDGPSFYRHGSENQQTTGKEKVHSPSPQEKKKPFKVTQVPTFKRRLAPQSYDYSRVLRHLRKQPADYYVVVKELTEQPTNGTSDVGLTKDERKIKTATQKYSQQKNLGNALGHSLNDILRSEQDAQRTLKIFDTNQNKHH